MRILTFLSTFSLSFTLSHLSPDLTTAIVANVILFAHGMLLYVRGGKAALKTAQEEIEKLNKGEQK